MMKTFGLLVGLIIGALTLSNLVEAHKWQGVAIVSVIMLWVLFGTVGLPRSGHKHHRR